MQAGIIFGFQWLRHFAGTIFGGFLYDLFIYTGPESPINTPWLGFKYLLTGGYWRKKKDQEKYEV